MTKSRSSAEGDTKPHERCVICGWPTDGGRCPGPICAWPEGDRHFKRIWTVFRCSRWPRQALDLYKVDDVREWAAVFAALLLGYLHQHRGIFASYELIIPSPTYIGPDGRAFDHTAGVIRAAIEQDDGSWPLRLGVMAKRCATTSFRTKPWRQRYRIATGELREALVVCQPELVKGKRVLVYDDVLTCGLTAREVARALRLSGASEVSQVVLTHADYHR